MLSYFDHFLESDITFFDAYLWHESANGYEFELFAFAANNQEGYALVIGPDSGRLGDMKNLLSQEFQATLQGWLVLKNAKKEVGKDMIATPAEVDLPAITYYENATPIWIIKIKPYAGSRLLKRQST